MLVVALVVALVVGGGVSVVSGRVAVASPVQPATNGYLNETATSPYTFVTRGFPDAPTGATIHVSFLNGDTDGVEHTFTLLNWSDRQVPSSYYTGNIGQLINKFGTLINLTESTEGATMTGTFTSPASPGWYEFVCMVSGHFTLGMWGIVAFGEGLPANISFGGGLPGPGLAVFIIVGTIVTLTVLAIVLGFVFGQRKGTEHEMPPERLGYPEPSTPEPLPSSPPRPPPYRP
jgi:plastocyanin